MCLATDVFALANATGYSAMWQAVTVLEFNFNVVIIEGSMMLIVDS